MAQLLLPLDTLSSRQAAAHLVVSFKHNMPNATAPLLLLLLLQCTARSYLAWALFLLEQQMSARIRASPNDEVAVIFYSTVSCSDSTTQCHACLGCTLR
jgi:hypothetical protein